ncbi:hypothetical protein A3L11_01380 [Thermococcus siculi]|uniref:Uncharacterized protein n=1 Tax=Thermococcus siculi TaxID=72803 RepID=A0A2Z2MJJ6_9EURY|nr:hypothetical protein [Thermococcus siculi]ASJ07948.1 hypothetical protein A3L11_01380 [Thermococcus siculi]
MNFRVAKLVVVLPVVVITGMAYSSIVDSHLFSVALGAILLGIFVSSGSLSKTVFLATVIYTVPFTIAASQFLPVAFPEAYRELGEVILKSPYFSTAIPVFVLLGLCVLADYIEASESWEKALRNIGWKGSGEKTLVYGAIMIILGLLSSLGILWLGGMGRTAGISAGAPLLPLLVLALGLVVYYSSIEGGTYRKALVAVEVPPGNGSVLIETPSERLALQVSRSMGFEWNTVRLEREMKQRPWRVVFADERGERVLSPLVESVDGKTLFLLYRMEEG